MKTVSADEMRELDRYTIEELGVPGEVLMERAGRGIAECVERITRLSGGPKPPIRCLAGGGNNGGDAFVAAHYLQECGFKVDLHLVVPAEKLKGDARQKFDRLTASGFAVKEITSAAEWDRLTREEPFRGILLDGLLGTGSKGAPRGAFGGAARYINANVHCALVVAIDLPSGLNADTGVPEQDAVQADYSVTMALPKHGMLRPEAIEHVGRIEVVDIGIPTDKAGRDPVDGEVELISAAEFSDIVVRRRPRGSHKGTFGRVLVIGGSAGYSGAISMASLSALRAGAGSVTAAVPRGITSLVAGSTPEIMVKGADETRQGSLSREMWSDWDRAVEEFDVVLLGPGMTRCDDSLKLVRDILRDSKVPLVVDADAIAVLEGEAHWFDRCDAPVVMTPHPGEMAKLMGKTVEEVQANRWTVAREASDISNATVVQKGAGTCIASQGRPLAVNLTGNPGMATAGSGDVLAGMIASFIAQGIEPHGAACAAVYLHGRAGDLAALRFSESGVIAGDLILSIPNAIRQLSIR